ncbi:MAG TPA: bifunctional adenosylcobinamide kinase/adenosylcobinamide-phosphate guanylyltransferase [Candidatus Limnocylindrales bacterium]|nr:bifunctional adenosylcobinamide kinase/adenosylcobinamide-phosphate guanylyltransferase [Candidatus Limnocylindrales bacterium]
MEHKIDGSMVLVTGGARSGKSTFAEKLAYAGGKKVIYLATARVEDDEMRERVARHKSRRPSSVCTVEEPLDPHLVIQREGTVDTVILMDCLTLLLSNRILLDLDQHGVVRQEEDRFADERLLKEAVERTLGYVKVLTEVALKSPAAIVVVTNEVGMGLVPEYPLGRVFRDLSGRANQILAAVSEQVWLVVCGIPQRIK